MTLAVAVAAEPTFLERLWELRGLLFILGFVVLVIWAARQIFR